MVYLDTSFIAPLFIAEDTSDAVENHLRQIDGTLVTSDWTRVEFASLLARRVVRTTVICPTIPIMACRR